MIHYAPKLSHDGLLGYNPAELMAGTFKQAHSLVRMACKYADKGSLIRGSIEMEAGTTKTL